MNLGPGEILVVLMVALIVLGPKRLPDTARQIGKAVREIRKATDEVRNEFADALDTDFQPRVIDGSVDLRETSSNAKSRSDVENEQL